MTARFRLANRRSHEIIEFVHDGFRYCGGVGRFPDGSIAEVFLDVSAKSGTAVAAAARDAAVLCSLCFQFGASVDVVRRALTRDHLGNAAGPIGAILDLLATEEAADG